MGALGQRMKSHMELKGLSPRTIQVYLQQMSQFVEYVGHSPERTDAEEIRSYLYGSSEESVGERARLRGRA